MNELEKILEALEKRVNFRKTLVKHEKKMGTITDVARNQGALEELVVIANIIDSCVNKVKDDWIPCSERLPEEHDSIFAIYKDTHLWSKSMFEKVSDPVNITYELEDGTRKTGTSYTLDGKWKIEKENSIVKKKVVAWQPLPEVYKSEEE